MTPYFRDIIKCDPSPLLQNVKCPVLAITGEKDLQASPTKNLAAMDEAFKSGKNKKGHHITRTMLKLATPFQYKNIHKE